MDRLVIDYLRNKGMNRRDEQDLLAKFKHFMTKYKRNSMRNPMRYNQEEDYLNDEMSSYLRNGKSEDFLDMFGSDNRPFNRFKNDFDEDDMYRMMKYMRNSMESEEHFTESEAKHLVSEMYHTENGRKHSGENYDMHKAKEVVARYRGILSTSVTPADVYVAINAQYHDYAELFKNWFGDNIDQKVIESAIVFWFKDVDAKSGNKLIEYFKEY